jgi:CMP-N-acetylneuraminic acid synthetase
MKVFCFIFARKGSKRLKKKNFKLVNSKPLIWHSINLAKKIKIINKIFVSSDCPKILNYSKKYDVNIINRPKFLATDKSNELLSWVHAIKYARKNFGEFDIFLSLPVTSPLRSKNDVVKIINALGKQFDLSIGITKSLRNPFFNMVSINKKNVCKIINRKKNFFRNQDAPSVYDVTTVGYAAKPNYLFSLNIKKSLFCGKVIGTNISRINSLDIDDKYDLELANFYYKTYKRNK